MADAMKTVRELQEVQAHRTVGRQEIEKVMAGGAHKRSGFDSHLSERCVLYGPAARDTIINTTFITCDHWLVRPGGRVPGATGQLAMMDAEQAVFIVKGKGTVAFQHREKAATMDEYQVSFGDCIYIEAFQPFAVTNTGAEDLVGISWLPTAAPLHVKLSGCGDAMRQGTGYAVVPFSDINKVMTSKSQLRPGVDMPDFSRCVVFGRWDQNTQLSHNITTVVWEYGLGSETPSDGSGFVLHNVEQCEYIIQGDALIMYGDYTGSQPYVIDELHPGSHFYHDAFVPHKFINVGDVPILGISFTPTGGYRDTWRVGSYAHKKHQ